MGRKDKDKKSLPKIHRPLPPPPPPATNSSSDEIDSDPYSDDDALLTTTKPTTSTQNHHSDDANSDDYSPPPPPPPKHNPTKPPTSKRPVDNTNPGSQKRVKEEDDKLAPSAQKPLFQRVWSDEDEIVILKGMIEYKDVKGTDPMSNVDDFLDFIRVNLHVVDANKSQIVGKVRRFKKRFVNAQKKRISDPHEMKIFELSKKIWRGAESGGKGGVEVEANGDVVKEEERGSGSGSVDLWEEADLEFGFSGEDKVVLKEGMEKMGDGERREVRKMIRKANEAYLEAYLLRLKVLKVAGKKVLDGLKNDLS